LQNMTPFLMLNHFHISQSAHLLYGIPHHPHCGQATVTYITQGSSKHEDSMGHAGII
ncbi:hypothetical protein F5148DRAFT_990052, partial [Russula earlei]